MTSRPGEPMKNVYEVLRQKEMELTRLEKEVEALRLVAPLLNEENNAARLVFEEGRPFAEAIVEIPGTRFAPPRRISLSVQSLTRLRSGSPARPDLYLYEGMILPGPTH